VWSRESIVEEMAALLWSSVAPDRGRMPSKLVDAGEDLAELYEKTNNTSLPAIASRMHRVAPDIDVEVAGAWLAAAALGDADDHAVDVIFRANVAIPSFELSARPVSGGLEIAWEGGGPLHRNPARSSGDRMMLLEDDPILQDGTGRWMKKVYPDTPLIVVDNVESAIANLKHHDMSLIVSDVDVVGNQNGIDFFHYVKNEYPDLVDKFVFFTGNSAAESEHYRYVPKGGATSKDLKAAITAKAPGGRAQRAPTKSPPTRGMPTASDVAAVVRDVAPTIVATDGPTGRPKTRFGDRKIFVSALWRVAHDDPRLTGMSFEQFKKALVVAHRERLLTMARADLVSAMDSSAVEASEIAADGAQFHFVVDPSVGNAMPAPAVVRGAAPAPRALSVSDIASAVKAAIPQIKGDWVNGNAVGRFGDRKVFIGPIWDIVSRKYPDLTRGQFDHALLVANRESMLELARLDMRGNVDPALVDASEIRDAFGTMHFVIDQNAR
jgi:hypothetical protein